MLRRKLVEERVGECRAAGHHIAMALADRLNGFLVVLPFPVEVIGKHIVKCIRRALSPSAREGAGTA